MEGSRIPRGAPGGRLERVDSRSGGAKAEVSEDGKGRVTSYNTVKDIGNFSLLGVIIETGRMHQIRAHLAAGHPLAGTPVTAPMSETAPIAKDLA